MNFVVRRLSTSVVFNYPQVKVNHEFHKIIKYVRPEKLPVWAPQRTCDLQPLPKVDPQWLTVENRPFADILDKLPEEKRRLFTVDFGPRSEGIKVILQDALESVRRHDHDTYSLEYKATWKTIKIRSFQHLFATQPIHLHNKRMRHQVKEMIDKRKQYLTKLRNKDYRRFEWLIGILGFLYKPNTKGVRIERKASITLLVNMMCEEIRVKKMKDYKDLLEEEKLPFLQEKLETLQQMESEELSINMPSSVADDIEKTRRRIALISMQTI